MIPIVGSIVENEHGFRYQVVAIEWSDTSDREPLVELRGVSGPWEGWVGFPLFARYFRPVGER